MANAGTITLQDLQSRFSAAGVYSVIRDATQQPQVAATGPLRLIYGFSRQGIFNTPVFIPQGDFDTAERLFGPIDKTLERRGSFFHRSLQLALQDGPVLAMNLLKLNNSVDENSIPTTSADVATYRSFSCDPIAANSTAKTKLLSSYFNKERFWKPSPAYLLATRSSGDATKILQFSNLSQQTLSIIVRKTKVKGFDISLRDWYGDVLKVPGFAKATDFVSDYMVDVIVLAGDYGPANYAALRVDPILGQFFDQSGLIASKLDAFLTRPEVVVKSIYSGSLIPNFRNQNGNSLYLEDIVNSQTRTTGLLCAVDRAALDALEQGTGSDYLDLVGHRLLSAAADSVKDADFLSYKGKLVEQLVLPAVAAPAYSTFTIADSITTTITHRPGSITVTVPVAATTAFAALTANLVVGSLFKGKRTTAGATAGVIPTAPVLEVTRVLKTASQVTFDVTCSFKDSETASTGSFVDLDTTVTTGPAGLQYSYLAAATRLAIHTSNSYYLADYDSTLYTRFREGGVANGDYIINASGVKLYLQFEELRDAFGSSAAASDYRKVLKVTPFTDAELTIAITAGSAPSLTVMKDSAGITVAGFVLISAADGLRRRIAVTSVPDVKKVLIPISEEPNLKTGQFVQGLEQDGITPRLTRVVSLRRITPEGQTVPTQLEVATADPVRVLSAANGSLQLERITPLDQYFPTLSPTALPGFKLKDTHLPNNTNARMKEITSVMTQGPLYDSLVDPEMVQFRYLVDTFNHGLESQSKRAITRLLRARQKALGLLNAPSAEEFKKSTSPRFTTSPTPVDPLPNLDVQYILSGGNLDENPEYLYTLPEEEDGASNAGFFFPNILIRDSDGSENSVPPAALVSNNFVLKFKDGNPHLPTAGPRRGILRADGISGLEYRLTTEQRGMLERKGINPLLQKADGTVMIYGNETGYKRFSSTLNNLSARDTLITIQQDTEDIYANYVFEWNTDTTRNEVVSLLRNYLSGLRDGYGAITNFDIVFDANNNPEFVLRESAAIVDFSVVLPDVAKKFVSRITVRRDAPAKVSAFTAV